MKLGPILLAAAGLAASGAPASAAQGADCSPAASTAAGAALRSARAELTAIALEEDDSLVPPATSRRIERVKDRLRDFVRAEMACAPASPVPEHLAEALAARGDASAGRPRSSRDQVPPDRHGDLLAYEVSRVASQPDMLAVVARLGIHCGTDSMLMLYRRTAAGWREAMVRRAEPYSEVKGGWGDLRFAVSPKDKRGRWFVATVSITPWCTSAWQGMPYALARPGPAPDRPTVFFRGKNTIYLGNEADLLVRAEPNAFELRHDGSSLDPEILIRRHVRRYSVAGESVRRVQPVAENVRDFVDEWIDSPWAEAKDWSGRDPALPGAHSELQSARYKTLGGFGSIRGCAGGASQVEIAGKEAPGWFLRVRGGTAGPWTVEKVERKAAPSCTGRDR
ncbi:MAG TPA: hypothetical protein VE053_05950 [Allosphingosinicella sp.]|nr:hypothetical protein [Allosphingosinicella sp.]